MRSKLLVLLTIAILILGGCANQIPMRPDQKVKLAEGEKLVNYYFDALVKDDPTIAEQYVVGKAKNTKLSTKGLRVLGYAVAKSQALGSGAKYLVKLFEASKSGEPAFFVTQEVTVTMSKEYVITDITSKQESSIKDDKGTLVYEEGNTTKTLFDIKSLPTTVKPQGGKSSFGIDKTTFASIALAPDKKNLLVATNGTHGFLGKYNLESKKLSPVDLYFEGSLNRFSWSGDSKYFAVEISKANGLADIILYRGDTDKRVELAKKSVFADSGVTRSRPFFAGSNFIFAVEGTQSKETNGWYFYNVLSGNSGRSFR